jgi:hypothetical protein
MKSAYEKHLSNERKNQLIDAWKYLKPHQKMWLFLRAKWWSMPTVNERIRRFNNRVNVWITYRLYKAHWMGMK